jgi:SAM-dependent methyltransferase
MIETLVYKPTAYRKKKLFPSSSSTSLVTRRFLTAVVSDTNLTLRKSASFASLTPTTTIEDTSSSFLFPIEDDSNDEIDRLVSQHYILRTAFNSDYSIPSSLFKKNNTIVLDVGCGPGTWTMEMASQFPKATFIGVDFRDMSPHDIKPKNCHFQQHLDIVKLPFGDNSVDYIFQRDMNWFLNAESWIPLIKEYFRILKPGGWIELVEPVSILKILKHVK